MLSRFETLPSTSVHVLTQSGSGPPALAVHGLGGSAYNWAGVAPRLDLSLMAMDLPGFGLSPPLPRHTISAFTATAVEVLEKNALPAVLLGNSMGALVTASVAAARPDLVDRLILIAPAVRPYGNPIPSGRMVPARLLAQSVPVLGESLARLLQSRLTPEEQVAMTFRMITADPARISPEQIASHEEIARRRRRLPWAVTAFRESITSTLGVISRPGRYDAIMDSISCPTLLVFGELDPVVEPRWLRALAKRHPRWDSVEMPGLGHVPMLESPVAVAGIVNDWLKAA